MTHKWKLNFDFEAFNDGSYLITGCCESCDIITCVVYNSYRNEYKYVYYTSNGSKNKRNYGPVLESCGDVKLNQLLK